MAGPIGEALICGGGAPFEGDVNVIRAMTRRMGIRFLDLDEVKNKARILVRLHRAEIGAVADVLIERRSLSGAEVAALVPDVRAAPLWAAPPSP